MSIHRIPRIELSGTSYEIGLKHGRLLSNQIRSQLELYRNLFFENCKFEWTQVLSVAEEFCSAIERLAPDLLQEMRGIADGIDDPNVGLLDIVALNSRSEIALGQWDDGCTSLAWKLGPRKQVLAQNWDWRRPVAKNLAIATKYQAGKPTIWMVIEPGIVGKIGFNSASVGVCLNAIRARPISTTLLPIHVLLRIALECDSASSAISEIERLGGAASSQHILIADRHMARGLELSPCGGVYLEEDVHGIILHTNHFLQNKLVDEPPWLESSPTRLNRAQEICQEIVSGVGVEHLEDAVDAHFLRDHFFSDTHDYPKSICCYPDPSRITGGDTETLFNIVMTFHDGHLPEAEVVFGKPGSEEESEVYHLPWP
ncbi:AAT-domain-containing protein [Obba rivulosa]|uniref:AAT-domain-containing protein n=1 Tax=Obba rivulosa TaxID=1052685 RepID=A0A8E2ART8_9APHY|nr:AAT-domain-containing protein [Obba rivulosa]